MGQPLSQYARLFLVDPEAFRASLDQPVLVWETPPAQAQPVQRTYEGVPWDRLLSSEPLVFQVAQSKARTYGSILLGRSEENDVRVAEESVSGEHAALNRREAKGDWWLMDCGSKNGTRLGGRKLVAHEWLPLPDRSVIALGHVELKFLLPGSLVDYLYVRSQ